MSINRDVDQDRAVTQAVLTGQQPFAEGSRNWLGHDLNSGAAKIDEMLLTGATRQQMGSARGAVDEHIRHLRETHGLPVTEAGEVLAFDRLALGVGVSDAWEEVWAELRGNLSSQPRCAEHPEFPCVSTLGQGAVNDILRVDQDGVQVRSHRTDNEDVIPVSSFRAWWIHLQQHGIAVLNPNDPSCPRSDRAVLVGAILARCLPSRIEVEGNQIRLIPQLRDCPLPEEVPEGAQLIEGASRTVLVNAAGGRHLARQFKVFVPGNDGKIASYPMKEWLRQNPGRLPPGTDPTDKTSHQLRDILKKLGWRIKELPDEVQLFAPSLPPTAESPAQPSYVPLIPALPVSMPGQTSAVPGDPNARLHTIKLVLEIIGVAVTVVGGLVALIWRFF